MTKPPTLENRINSIRAEVDAFVEDRVQELRKQYELPDTWLRRDLMGGMCKCEAYLAIKEKEAAV